MLIDMNRLLASMLLITIAQCCAGADNSRYLVFVGEKVSVEEVRQKPDESMDRQFRAKYRIIETVLGNYAGQEIEFTAYDHYGVPGFSNYPHVLLYVVLEEGRYFHEKYQYSPLCRTNDGRWAGPYDAFDYRHEYNRGTSIKPEVIDCLASIVRDVSSSDPGHLKTWLPEPYYRIENGKAVAVYGNYVPELFLLKKNGVLKAREEFQ
jgi:hypothetical protein